MLSGDRSSEVIRTLRKDCAMTQVELAATLNVAPASVHRWEAGTSSPEFETIVALWSLAIKFGSATSTFFAEFLTSRTDAIRPLFDAAQMPAVKVLDSDLASLPVDQRRLVSAYVRMLKDGSNKTADKVIRLLLEPWKQTPPKDLPKRAKGSIAKYARRPNPHTDEE
jgi:transcriptional regulator with XRE-family HTH domain